MDKTYFVYMMTNENNTLLYTGITNDLERRVMEHKSGSGGNFSSKYKITKLVYYDTTNQVEEAT